MSTCADVGSVIESKMSVVQTSNVGFTSEVSDYLVVHTGPEWCTSSMIIVDDTPFWSEILGNSVWASLLWDHLVGLVVKAPASRAEDPGFESRLRGDFSGVKSYQ